jgi:sugar/nucleoside kinase (ribokinase family)
MVDVVVAGGGHDAVARLGPGGTAANVTAWAASLGADAVAVGAVGNDAAGRFLRAELERRGVEASFACIESARTGTFVVADGALHVDRGANAALTAERLPELPTADATLVSGYLPGDVVAAALGSAHSDLVVLDAAGLDELPGGGDGVLANERRAVALTGKEPEAAVRALAERYRLACVTLGARGAVAVLDGRLERAEPPGRFLQEVPGAGDAFAAGLLLTLAQGGSLADALGEGCRCGAAAAGTAGWPDETD